MNKKSMMIAGVVLVLGIIAAGLFVLIVNSAERRLVDQLELGRKYLEEMNYEQAIVAFEAVIAIDPKCEEAYLSLAEAYVAQGVGDSGVYLSGEDIYVVKENVKKAMEILEEGYSQTGLETILTRLEELSDCYQAGGEDKTSATESGSEVGSREGENSQASGNSEDGSQGQSAIDENDPFVQFLNAPFTDENCIGDVINADALTRYAKNCGYAMDTHEAMPMGDLLLSYRADMECVDLDTGETFFLTYIALGTNKQGQGGVSSRTEYDYSNYGENSIYSVSTRLGNPDTMTRGSVPSIGGFAGFLKEHECFTLEEIMETIGMDDTEIMEAVSGKVLDSSYETQIETAYGLASISIIKLYDDDDVHIDIKFLEENESPFIWISICEMDTYAYDNILARYIMIEGHSATLDE